MNKRQLIIADRYQVNNKLGEGGSGTVFLVSDKKLNKKWALKLVSNRSDQELNALCKVNRFSFPRIVDTGMYGDKHYIVMDYIDGIPLYDYVRLHKCSEKELIELSIQLAEAMDYLHNCSPSMLYLDCKPDNILVDNKGKLHLVDLGSIYMKDMSRPGRISGTNGFASPEQRNGSDVDITSDIFTYGRTLMRLFEGTSNSAIQYVIRRCTNENKRLRFQSMREVISILNDCIGIKSRIGSLLRPTTNIIIKSIFALFTVISCRVYINTDDIIYLTLGIMLFLLLIFPLFKEKELKKMKWICNKNIHMGQGLKILIVLLTVAIAALLLGNTYSHAEEQYLVTLYDSTGSKILYKGQQVYINGDGSVSVYIPPKNVTPDTMPVKAELGKLTKIGQLYINNKCL